MDVPYPAPTVIWPINAVFEHLSKHPHVDGIMQIGSLAAGSFNSFSDYDVVLVLDDAPVLWYVGVTCIDHRFTDLLFIAPRALERIATLSTSVPLNDSLTPIIRWLQTGQIVFDRSQRLTAAQQHVTTGHWIDTYPDNDLFGAWFSTNYNLAQTRRLLTSHEPVYKMAADIRMATHAAMDVWYSYFTIRKIVDSGEKNALRYLLVHDPAFLTQYQRFIHEADLHTKLAHYEQAAALALAPFGDLWAADATVMNEPDTRSRWVELFEK